MSHSPNFIFLQGEDAGRYLGCYGDPLAKTPHLDRIAQEGCRFDYAFSTAPVCAPSRSAMATGRYAWSMGSHHMRCTLEESPPVFTERLREGGYYVNWADKTDFNFEPRASFADDRRAWIEDLREGRLPEDKPFFLYTNLGNTHESAMWPPKLSGPGGAFSGRMSNDWRLGEEERAKPEEVRVPAYLADHREVRNDIARFYDALAIVDHEVGEILAALDASGRAGDTYVVYLTDHGRGLWREKRWPYAAGIHNALVVKGPGIEAGSVCDDLVSWVDIAPTILSLAGQDIPESVQGRAFLGPRRAPPRCEVFAGRDRMDETFDRVRVVREQRFHYLRNFFPELPRAQRLGYMDHMATTAVMHELYRQDRLAPEQREFLARVRPAEELYDSEADPDMVRNLAADPAYREHLERLRAKLDAYLATGVDQGAKSERRLIEEGVLTDRLTEYIGRRVDLDEKYALEGGFTGTITEMPDEQADGPEA